MLFFGSWKTHLRNFFSRINSGSIRRYLECFLYESLQMFVNMGLVFWFMLGDTWGKQTEQQKVFSAIDPKICINCLRIWFYDFFFGILLSVSFITVIWITRIDFSFHMVAKVHSLEAHVSLKIRFPQNWNCTHFKII